MDLDYFVLDLGTPHRAELQRRQRPARGPFEGADAGFDLPDVLGGALGVPETTAAEPGDIKLEKATMSDIDAREEARDPSKIVAPIMPVSVIAPCLPSEFGIASDGDPLAAAAASQGSWGIGSVGAGLSGFTGAGVTVAVLDTGIDAAHPAFAGVDLVQKDFTAAAATNAPDRQGHGTHCAGTVFGRDVDGVRIGIARGVSKALIGKVLDDRGRGSTASVLSALHWASEQGANIVSMSLGFDFPGMQEQLVQSGRPAKLATSMALKAYRENLAMFATLLEFLGQENAGRTGMVVVAASGNESLRQIDPNFVIDTSLPAASSADILSVGAFGRKGDLFQIAPFSNVNPVLCAPGVDIVSAKAGGGLAAMSGTSMACPHVAGLAALWWERAAKAGRAKASTVRAHLVASTLASGFEPGVGFADRGEGRAMAPGP